MAGYEISNRDTSRARHRPAANDGGKPKNYVPAMFFEQAKQARALLVRRGWFVRGEVQLPSLRLAWRRVV